MRTMLTLLVIVAAAVAGSGDASAGAPTDQVRAYTDQVLKVLEDPALRDEERRHERRAAVRRLAAQIFDVSETAKRALGRHWQPRTPVEREEFVQLFADLLEGTYIARIDEYGGERIRYMSEAIDGDQAAVRARIVTRTGKEVPIESRMLRRGDRWLIYDITIENVSLVANYRSQFDRIIRTSSYADLVKRLRKRGEFLNEKGSRPRPTS